MFWQVTALPRHTSSAARAARGAEGEDPRQGTLLFSAPEQLRDGLCDRAVDVWAFGCVLVCLFTDRGKP